jgi:prophage antirepressor-like protein
VLDLKNTTTTLSKLDNDEKLTFKVFMSGQNRDLLCVNEPGLYSLILRSYKPEAKAFKRWVTHDVLPSIRKQGAYVDVSRMTMDKSARDLLRAALDEIDTLALRLEQSEQDLEMINEEVALLSPKAEVYDEIPAMADRRISALLPEKPPSGNKKNQECQDVL